MVNEKRDQVLLQIARCPAGDPPMHPHPTCSEVVGAQSATSKGDFQVPEPWRGDIINAPLLFVSSNPGWDPGDDCPTADCSDAEIIDFYQIRGFPQEFPKNRNRDGSTTERHVQFWAAVRRRAAELYREGRCIVAGRDFALTEVVHCKSKREQGVTDALTECVRRHFDPIARLAGARVVVILGEQAANALNIAQTPQVLEREWYGRKRFLAWLPHPNARLKRTFKGRYSPDDVAVLRAALVN